jgi:hypothetical protein
VSVGAGSIYWASIAPVGPYAISRANLDGTGAEDLNVISRGAVSCAVAVDAAHVYWGNRGTLAIGRANLDGTEVNEDFIPGAGSACGIALDAANIYWGGSGTLGRASLDGTDIDERFITGVNEPCGVAIDAGHVYWANLAHPSRFFLGIAKRDTKTGTVRLRIELDAEVPGPGRLRLRGRGIVKRTRQDPGADTVTVGGHVLALLVKAKGKKRRQLNSRGKAKVKAKVTYSPDGGEPNTQSKRIKLKKRV